MRTLPFTLFLLITPFQLSAQSGDLLSNRAIVELVEEALIADLMLSRCEGVIGSEEGVAAITDYADRLARSAGYAPEAAAEALSTPTIRSRIEAGALARLARMGARPDDIASLCRVANGVAGRGGVLGTLLLPR